jgi:DNA-binding YbaB/EbfC family protein
MPFFNNLGQLAGLMRSLPRLREETEKLQQRLGQIVAEGDAGGGMVKVRVNGHMEVVRCILAEEAMTLGDREMLEDLIRAATNQAVEKVRQQVGEETARMVSEMGMPAGFKLPGLS